MTVSIYSSKPWGNLFKRRYTVTLTDLLGNDHVEIIGIFRDPESEGGSAHETALLASKKEAEIEQYKTEIIDGGNPFLNDSLWNDRVVLLKAILDDALSLPATDPIVYAGLPLLSRVTDAELMALYGRDQAWVDDVRKKASDLLGSKAVLDGYQPMMGG